MQYGDGKDQQYETQDQHQHKSIPDEALGKLGSAQPGSDPLDAVDGAAPAGMPTEFVAAERRPTAVVPADVIPVETRPTDFMTPDTRPVDVRPREVFPAEGR